MDPNAEADTTPQGMDKSEINGSGDEASVQELSSEKADLETKLADEVNLRRFTENVLDSRQREIENKESQTYMMSSKVEALKRELAETQHQLAEARNQTKAKNKQLQEAREQVFRLQPRRNDITDSEARDAYKALCSNVQRWVENRLRGVLDDMDHGRLKTRPPPPQATRFVGFLREPSRRCLTLDETDEYHVVAVIMNYLWLVLFSKSFYIPLDDSQGDSTVLWIDELENTMSKLSRDVGHCREWRCETLTAITSQPAFKTRRVQHLNLVTDDLTALLSIFAPKATPAELHASVRRNIVEPAADLAHRLHLAPSIYSLKWPARTAPTRLEVYECLNLASGGMILDLASTKQDSPSRRDVVYLFDVCPGLFVERVELGKKLGLRAIAKPIVLVNKGDGEVPRKPTMVKWLWDSAASAQAPGRGSAPRATATSAKRSSIGAAMSTAGMSTAARSTTGKSTTGRSTR